MNTLETLILFAEPYCAILAVGLVCAYLGLFCVFRRIVFTGVALAQLAAAGVAGSFFLADVVGGFLGRMAERFGATWGSLGMAILGVIGLRTPPQKSRLTADAIVGLAYAGSAALAVLLVWRSSRGLIELKNLLAGEVLLTGSGQLSALWVGLMLVTVVQVALREEFLLVSFDPAFARAQGLPESRYQLLFLGSLAVAVALALKTCGLLLVFAFLVIPPLIGLVVADRLVDATLAAMASAAASSLLGFLLAVQIDLPVGPSVTVVALGLLGACWLLRRLPGEAPALYLRYAILGAGALAISVGAFALLTTAERRGDMHGEAHGDPHGHGAPPAAALPTPTHLPTTGGASARPTPAGPPAELASLSERARHGSLRERVEAIHSLAELRHPAAVGPLLDAMLDVEEEVSVAALEELDALCRASLPARQALERALSGGSSARRWSAARVSDRLGDPRALQVAAGLLSDPEFPLLAREAVIELLEERAGKSFGYDPFGDEDPAALAALQAWAKTYRGHAPGGHSAHAPKPAADPEAVETSALLAAYRADPREVHAERILARGAGAQAALVEALGDPATRERGPLLALLRRFPGGPAALRQLSEAAPLPARCALLRQLDPSREGALLLAALGRSEEERAAALEALGEAAADPELRALLRGAAAEGSPSAGRWLVRHAPREALSLLSDAARPLEAQRALLEDWLALARQGSAQGYRALLGQLFERAHLRGLLVRALAEDPGAGQLGAPLSARLRRAALEAFADEGAASLRLLRRVGRFADLEDLLRGGVAPGELERLAPLVGLSELERLGESLARHPGQGEARLLLAVLRRWADQTEALRPALSATLAQLRPEQREAVLRDLTLEPELLEALPRSALRRSLELRPTLDVCELLSRAPQPADLAALAAAAGELPDTPALRQAWRRAAAAQPAAAREQLRQALSANASRRLPTLLQALPALERPLELAALAWARPALRASLADALLSLPRGAAFLLARFGDLPAESRRLLLERVLQELPPGALGQLAPTLEDPDPRVRELAQQIVTRYAERAEAQRRLAELTRAAPAESGELSRAQLRRRLLEFVQDPETPYEVLLGAVDALGTLGDPRALPDLVQLLASEDPELRAAARAAIHRCDALVDPSRR